MVGQIFFNLVGEIRVQMFILIGAEKSGCGGLQIRRTGFFVYDQIQVETALKYIEIGFLVLTLPAI